MSKGYFSYTRVSTQRQGQKGTSLSEQTAAIDRYANTWGLNIVKRFEERETAAKTGRPVFLDLVKQLKRGAARGVIIHKIDRSARNLRDWSELGSLIDLGIEVHFVNESLDLNSRGGRLSADIQAVVASDYIRNLREETIKGIRGRIKQGFYPFPAPPGYANAGPARPKTIDPIMGPLIKKAFELYASGRHNLHTLTETMSGLGLRSRLGRKISKNALHYCLRNPFYMGLIKVRSMSEIFIGQHRPIISKELFDDVQDVLNGKSVKKKTRHTFIFRRRINCGTCANLLVGERQKGHVYYRCHTRRCAQPPLKEELVAEQLCDALKLIRFEREELAHFEQEIRRFEDELPEQAEKRRLELVMREQLNSSRLEKLADAYMDGVFDKETYATKKNSLITERVEIRERIAGFGSFREIPEKLRSFLELANSAYSSYKSANEVERRELVDIVVSNFRADGKKLLIKLNSPFDKVAARHAGPVGCPIRDTFRTIRALLSELMDYFRKNTYLLT